MKTDYSLIRIFDTSAEWVIMHINFLPAEDKYLRFGYTANEDQIRKYVENTLSTANTRTHSDFWYAVKHNGEIIATLHIAIRDEMAEFGFTTSTEYRNQGIGQMLFGRGFQLVTEFSISRIYLMFLSQNRPMRHIAKKFGLAVVVDGSDAESSIEIQYPVPLSRIEEVKYYLWDKK